MDYREVLPKRFKWTPLTGTKRKAPTGDRLDDWPEPPAKQMAIIEDKRVPFIFTIKDGIVNSGSGEGESDTKKDDAANNKESENSYFEFEGPVEHVNNCEDDDDNNNNEGFAKNNNEVRSMVLSEEVRETIGKRSHENSRLLLPQHIVDQMCENTTSRALILWQPPTERSICPIVKTPETIAVMNTVDEEDEEEDHDVSMVESLEKNITNSDSGDMEL